MSTRTLAGVRAAARRSPAVVAALALSASLTLAGCGDDVVDDGVEQDVEEGVDDAEQGVEEGAEDVEEGAEDVEGDVEEGAEDVEGEVDEEVDGEDG